MIPLFKSLVRPIIEFGNVVWCPKKRKHIDIIESVQRHFTKCIIGMRNVEYKDRLKALKLPSLEFRRLRGDLIEIYKMTHNFYDTVTTNSLISFNQTSTRSHKYKLLKPRVNTSTFLHFFTNRIINVWNNLPGNIVEAKSLNCFKNYIDIYFKDCMYDMNFNIS